MFIYWCSFIGAPEKFTFQMDRKYSRFKYSEETLATAIHEINEGLISLNKASATYCIPKSTLHNKITAKVPNVRKMGPSPVLTYAEEQRLSNWILSKAKLGFPMHPEEVKDAVQKVLKADPRPNKFTDDRPGDKWLKLFLRRYPEVSKRNTEIISKSRASVTESAIRQWFLELTEYLETENMLEMMADPSRIYNADETGMRTCMKSGLVLGPAKKNFQNLYEIAGGNEKESITVLCNYSADGSIAPPMIVFPYKRIPKELAHSVPKEWAVGRSESGWMTSATFFEYVANIFYPWLLQKGIKFPVIFFIDGHKSHYNLELYEFCVEKQIILYCLYPNSTHILQPCDVSIFRPLKNEWKSVCRIHKQRTSTPITRHNFSLLFKEAFDKACKPDTIKNGFKRCGLYPLNPEEVDYSKCISTRRNEIFPNDLTSDITTEDYKICLKVMDYYFGKDKFVKNDSTNMMNEDIQSFWNFCKLHSEKQTTLNGTNDLTSDLKINTEPFTESFIDNLPIEIDGILFPPISDTDDLLTDFYSSDVTIDLQNKQNCLEILESILERVFDIVERKNYQNESIKHRINIISNIVVKGKAENVVDSLWEKHLHWPKQEGEMKNKKRKRVQMPYAITSNKWVEYHNKQEQKKVAKEETITNRKLDKLLKKTAAEKKKMETQKKKLKKRCGKLTQDCESENVTQLIEATEVEMDKTQNEHDAKKPKLAYDVIKQTVKAESRRVKGTNVKKSITKTVKVNTTKTNTRKRKQCRKVAMVYKKEKNEQAFEETQVELAEIQKDHDIKEQKLSEDLIKETVQVKSRRVDKDTNIEENSNTKTGKHKIRSYFYLLASFTLYCRF